MNSAMKRFGWCTVWGALLLGAVSCTQGDKGAGKAGTAPQPGGGLGLAPAKDSGNAEVWSVAPAGSASFEMKGKLETIRGTFGGAVGTLQLDLSDLRRSRGAVEFDIATLSIQTFEEAAKNVKQAASALLWFEVEAPAAPPAPSQPSAPLGAAGAPAAAAAAPPSAPAASAPSALGGGADPERIARFTLRSIERAEPNDVAAGAGAERKVELEATGELLLHGQRSEQRVALEATFTFTGAKATGLTLRTLRPMVVNLAAHEVRPRDPAGKLLATITDALRLKVAEEAEVTLSLSATPTGQRAELPAAPPAAPRPAPSPPPSAN